MTRNEKVEMKTFSGRRSDIQSDRAAAREREASELVSRCELGKNTFY